MTPTNHKAGGLLVNPFRQHVLRAEMTMPTGYELWPELSYIRELRPLEDQGQVSACAAYAVCADIQAAYWLAHGVPKDFGELALYAEAKKEDGMTGKGTTLEAAVWSAKTLGYVKDIRDIQEVQTRDELKWAIAQRRHVICGFQIHAGWNDCDRNGEISEGGESLGGHAVNACAFNPRGVVIANSWGKQWAVNGFGELSWESFDAQFLYGLAVEWEL